MTGHIETDKEKRVAQILATDATREQLADALWCAEGCVRSLVERTSLLNDKISKLREELAKWERLAAGIDLPEYPVTQFKPKDLECENAKLREMAVDMYAVISRNNSWWDWARKDTRRFADRMRNLGIEVDG